MTYVSTQTFTEEALEKALNGGAITRDEAYQFIRAEGTLVPELMRCASLVRDRRKGRRVAYSRKVFIPLTNLCRDRCGYCTFVKAPNHPQAHTMTPEEVLGVADAGRKAGCKEALFSLGEKPEEVHPIARKHLGQLGYPSMTAYLVAMCQLVIEETGLLPHCNSGVLEREEVAELREVNASMGLMLENISPRLLEKGQAHYGCVGKDPDVRMATMHYAGEMKVPFTTGILIGIGETLEERVDSLFAIKELHEEYGHIQEVIIQNFRAKPDTRMRGFREPTAVDMVVTIAVARLILGGDMNIQAPPNLTPEAYQFYLLAGINDWGGISPVTKDFINPEKAWPKIAELKERTEMAGFELKERLAIYPEYIVEKAEYMNPFLKTRILGWVNEEGYVKGEEMMW
ncbi:MAG: 7,8-didemethyl-8-hydroxy-5-deazariboflavin synthase CofG [Dehalococcoidia bacterium]